MAARVRLATGSDGPGVDVALVDVSAGGLRVRGDASLPFETGTEVAVQIWPEETSELSRPGDVSLRGEGVVLRVNEGATGRQAALRFREPLKLREPFESLFLY